VVGGSLRPPEVEFTFCSLVSSTNPGVHRGWSDCTPGGFPTGGRRNVRECVKSTWSGLVVLIS
jgi:hypothetical protein